jgi:aspartate-semialdehyde dehydrogenase
MAVVAVVHPTSLLARELRERLEARPELCHDLRLLSVLEDEVGTVTESAGAATFVGRLDEDTIEGLDLLFLCGDIATDRGILERLPRGLPVILLSDGAGPDDAPAAVAGVRPEAIAGLDRVTSPHPAAVACVLLLDALRSLEPARADATVVTPVSSLGDAGIEELFEQTRGILAFSGAATRGKRFPAQIAFNLLPGEEDVGYVERSVTQALGEAFPVSLQLVTGGVFHGVAVSLRVELGRPAPAAEVRKHLGRSPWIRLARDPRRVGPVAAAGVEDLVVGTVRATDRPGELWIWAAMDNLIRGGAANAVALAETLLGFGRPS